MDRRFPSTPHLGVFLPTMTIHGTAPVDIVDAARHAEALGYESVWVVDQLIAGTGVPLVDSIVALSAAAGATEHIRLGVGVMIMPLRPVVWIAKQVASLQQLSGGRVIFGAGVGGDRHTRSWAATGVSRSERGARTDDALAAFPDLVAGNPTRLPDVPGSPTVQLAPGVRVPPIVVGGTSDAALRRVVRFAEGWFGMPVPPAAAAPTIDRLRQLAAEVGRAAPSVTGAITVALDGDPTLPGRDEIARVMTDPDGLYGMPTEAVASILVTGGAAALAERTRGWSAVGADRVVLTLAAGDWHAQAALAASAVGTGLAQVGGATDHPSCGTV